MFLSFGSKEWFHPPNPPIPTTSLLVEPKTHHPTRHKVIHKPWNKFDGQGHAGGFDYQTVNNLAEYFKWEKQTCKTRYHGNPANHYSGVFAFLFNTDGIADIVENSPHNVVVIRYLDNDQLDTFILYISFSFE